MITQYKIWFLPSGSDSSLDQAERHTDSTHACTYTCPVTQHTLQAEVSVRSDAGHSGSSAQRRAE